MQEKLENNFGILFCEKKIVLVMETNFCKFEAEGILDCLILLSSGFFLGFKSPKKQKNFFWRNSA